jgi:haloacid dehalogenase superfamily, subfamily IA, variant 3 with third motif having DD or ED
MIDYPEEIKIFKEIPTDIRGVVFDMDGTLFDTERVSQEGWIEAGRQAGYDITYELIKRWVGTNDAEKILRDEFGPKLNGSQIREIRNQYIADYMREKGLPMKLGARQLLDDVKNRGLTIALASSTYQKYIVQMLGQAEIIDYFDVVVGGDAVDNGKPAPDIYRLTCKKIGLNPGLCLAIEDSPNGVRSAAAAGLHVVMVPDSIHPTPEIERLLFALSPNLVEVSKLINSVN